MNEQPEKRKNNEEYGKTVTEHLEVAGNQLVERVKALVAEGNVRRIILRAPDDKVMMEVNLTAGAVVGGIVTLAAPWLAAIGAAAALVSRMRVEVVRDATPNIADKEVSLDEQEARATEKLSSTGRQKVRIELDDD